MTLASYHGHETLSFPDYLDLGTGKTLTAQPREEPYDIAPASGRLVPDLPAGWFTPLEGEDLEAHAAKVAAAEAGRLTAEGTQDAEGAEHEDAEPQQF